MKIPILAQHCNKNKRNLIFIKAYIIDNCNYNCTYCYNKKPRTNNVLDLNKLENFINVVYKVTQRNIFLELIGGEPTLHKKLIDFCKCMCKKTFISNIYIYSNFSADINVYIELLKNEKIQFDLTWHSDINNLINKHFYFKAKKLLYSSTCQLNSNNIAFNVMLEHNNIMSSITMYHMLKKLTPFVDLSMVGDIDRINSIKRYKYDDNIYSIFKTALLNRNDDPEIYIKYNDESEKMFSINEMMDAIDKQVISFYSWICNAGIDRFYIHCNNNIWSCQEEFENGFLPIGNITNITNTLFNRQPIICKCEACICEAFIYKIYNKNK